LKSNGERFSPDMGLQIALEHWHRYYLALERVKDKVVLDLACGEGYGSALLATHAKKVIAIDVDKKTIKFASAKYARDNLRFQISSATSLPLEAESVDVVVSFETIEHLKEDEQALFMDEICRVLTPDGELIISSPDRLAYSEARAFTNPFHLHELTSEEFSDSLGKRFPFVKVSKQRTGFLSLVSSGYPLRSFSIKQEPNGDYSNSSNELTFDYSIAMCSRKQLPENGFRESVNFDSRLLTNILDPITEKLVAASAVAEERAAEIWSLIEERELERASLHRQLAAASTVSEERAAEIASLIETAERDKAVQLRQLTAASAIAEERATEIALLIETAERDKAAQLHQLTAATAVAEERAAEIELLIKTAERDKAAQLRQFTAATAVAEERAAEIALLIKTAERDKASLLRQLTEASAVAEERAAAIASLIEIAERDKAALVHRLKAASADAELQAGKMKDLRGSLDMLTNENRLLLSRLRLRNYIPWLLGKK
jgi:predicted SAM-dependent methyltransferase